MYEIDDVTDVTELEPGTNVMIAGPPMTGKRDLALDVLASGAERGEGSIVVSTKDSAPKILEHFAEITSVEEYEIGVVDCVTRQRGIGTVDEDDPRVKYASSPVDLTGIGIKLSEFLQEFYELRECTENRIVLHSVSTLLMYSDLRTVFRFLHVFTGRIQSADALGLCVIDSTAHDDQTMNTLKQLFDVIVELEETDEGERRIHTAGHG